MTFWNGKVAEIVEKALKNATYTSPRIQKVNSTCFLSQSEESHSGDAKFCIMVDDTCDESMKEQMDVVFRYVNTEGFVKDLFFWAYSCF